jgi:hypothetical protein
VLGNAVFQPEPVKQTALIAPLPSHHHPVLLCVEKGLAKAGEALLPVAEDDRQRRIVGSSWPRSLIATRSTRRIGRLLWWWVKGADDQTGQLSELRLMARRVAGYSSSGFLLPETLTGQPALPMAPGQWPRYVGHVQLLGSVSDDFSVLSRIGRDALWGDALGVCGRVQFQYDAVRYPAQNGSNLEPRNDRQTRARTDLACGICICCSRQIGT